MDVIVNQNMYSLSNQIGHGGEGEVYQLNQDLVAKVYYEVNATQRQKVLSLCQSFANNSERFGQSTLAFPQHPAYENSQELENLVGFSMPYFRDCKEIESLFYELEDHKFSRGETFQFTDETAIDFIYKVFELLDNIHRRANIVIGDVNPGNILYSPISGLPVFVDLDSVQIGEFRCKYHTLVYLDPAIHQKGKNLKDQYNYSTESDVFSMACICYRLFVGLHPFDAKTKPLNAEIENMKNGISTLRCCVDSSSQYISDQGMEYLWTEEDDTLERLRTLQKKDETLYNFFVSVFVNNERTSLMSFLPSNDPRHPAYTLLYASERTVDPVFKNIIDGMAREATPPSPDDRFRYIIDLMAGDAIPIQPVKSYSLEEDPEELNLFLSTYSIDSSVLISDK